MINLVFIREVLIFAVHIVVVDVVVSMMMTIVSHIMSAVLVCVQ